jgi:biotin transport system substrate-specific component
VTVQPATRDLVLSSVFAALIAGLGLAPPITLVFPVPITLQSLGVMMAGLIIGPWRAAAACALVIALVAAGMPLLAGGRGGLGVFVGPTAGFLLAWPVGAIVAGLIARGTRTARRGPIRWLALFVAAIAGGVLIVYAGGIAWLATVGGLGFVPAAIGSLAFVPGDLVKAALAATAARAVERAYPVDRRRV